MSFKGKGQEKAKQTIKANQKRPFFGNFEYSKRMQSMSSFQFKIVEQQRPATVMAEHAMRNSLQNLMDIGTRKNVADAIATDYSTTLYKAKAHRQMRLIETPNISAGSIRKITNINTDQNEILDEEQPVYINSQTASRNLLNSISGESKRRGRR